LYGIKVFSYQTSAIKKCSELFANSEVDSWQLIANSPIELQDVQVSDTTGDDSSNVAGNIKII
jgi:hypothetical protein